MQSSLGFVPDPLRAMDAAAAPQPGRTGAGDVYMAAAVTAFSGFGLTADAAQLPVAPSGVNSLPESEQTFVVLAIFGLLAVGSFVLLAVFEQLRRALPEGWFAAWQKTWPFLGFVYMAAGVAHFTAKDAFEAIYPPQGTWGFWYLPGSPEFHVIWTGVAELLGGTALFVGAILLAAADTFKWTLPSWVRELHALSALGLFLLTIVVSPANIYMYTHGAQMIGLTPSDVPIPVAGHYVRAAAQVLLLSILWKYYQDTKPSSGSADAAA